MTKKQRTILFIICLLLFCLIAPAVIFYSQGYRIDFKHRKITQTGGIFLRVSPKVAKVYLNGKLKDKTDPFFGSLLIENLLPQKYLLRVERENYHFWEKEVEVKEKLVKEFKNLLLIPKNPEFKLLFKDIEDFYFFPDFRYLILKEKGEEEWSLKLFNLEKFIKSHLIGETDISKKGATLLELRLAPNKKRLFLKAKIENELRYFSLSLEKIPSSLDDETEKTWNFNLDPKLDCLDFQILKNDIYCLDSKGNIWKNQTKIIPTSFPLKEGTNYQLKVLKDNIFLLENQTLYHYNNLSQSFEKIKEGVKSLVLSPDQKKIAYFSDFEIWLLFLKESFGQPLRKENEKVFLTRFSEKINQLFWLSPYYLIFSGEEKIKVSEIDNRDKINIVELAEFKNPKIFWDLNKKRLYVLSQRKLYVSEELIK